MFFFNLLFVQLRLPSPFNYLFWGIFVRFWPSLPRSDTKYFEDVLRRHKRGKGSNNNPYDRKLWKCKKNNHWPILYFFFMKTDEMTDRDSYWSYAFYTCFKLIYLFFGFEGHTRNNIFIGEFHYFPFIAPLSGSTIIWVIAPSLVSSRFVPKLWFDHISDNCAYFEFVLWTSINH